MKINANFERRIPGKGGRFEYKSVTGIEVENELWDDSDQFWLRRVLQWKAPGNGWRLCGYCRVKDQND